MPKNWVFVLSFEFFPWVLSFFLSFDIFFHVFLIKLVNFLQKKVQKFLKSADFLGLRLEFWVFSLSFEFFSPWVFFRTSKKKAWFNAEFSHKDVFVLTWEQTHKDNSNNTPISISFKLSFLHCAMSKFWGFVGIVMISRF